MSQDAKKDPDGILFRAMIARHHPPPPSAAIRATPYRHLVTCSAVSGEDVRRWKEDSLLSRNRQITFKWNMYSRDNDKYLIL